MSLLMLRLNLTKGTKIEGEEGTNKRKKIGMKLRKKQRKKIKPKYRTVYKNLPDVPFRVLDSVTYLKVLEPKCSDSHS